MAIQKGRLGAIYASYGSSIVATSEACELVSSFTYKITDIEKRYWDKSQTVTVYENAVESTKAYTLEYPGGRIVFPSAPTTPVTVDCKYFKVARVGGFRNWSLDSIGMELADVTEFSDLWVNRESLLGDFAASCERYWLDDAYANPDNIETNFIFVFYDKLNVTTKINPWGEGNFELDDNADGIANGWAAFSTGTPAGSRTLVSGGFASDKFQRITVTNAILDDVYGISNVLGDSAAGDQMAVGFRYKSSGTTGLDIKVKIGSTGVGQTLAVAADWTHAVEARKFTGITDMDIFIFLKSTGVFGGTAHLDIDFLRAVHLPSGNAQNRWEGYGRIATDDISAPVADLVREAVSISGDGEIYYRTDEVQL